MSRTAAALPIEAMPVTAMGAMMRRLEVALRDREWEGCPIGGEVARFMRPGGRARDHGRGVGASVRECAVHVRGPILVMVWTPPLGLGLAETGRPRRRTYALADDWWKPWTWEWVSPSV